MKTIQDELKELAAILHSNHDGKEEEYQRKFLSIQERYTSKEDSEAIGNFILNGYKELSSEATEIDSMLSLQERIKEMKEIIPISYIARKYFGKSTAWLQQRIYGYKVRGRVYRLSEQDRETLNFALQDISKKIGSLSIP